MLKEDYTMKQHSIYFLMVLAFTALGMDLSPRAVIAAVRTTPASNDDVQVLTSGPIHEAFAEAVTLDPEPGIVAPNPPPALIEEIPPEQKPEGDVQWISGYWAWDDERTGYIWVSGIWRVPPPGRQWVPGYWNSVPQGYQWISGYWANVRTKETKYLPEPPESVEIGPSSNAPSSNHIWIPGCWVWYQGRYAWRPGYWTVVHPDWIWVPDHYTWTPRGYIFVGGYWDYTVIHRGVLFASVVFSPRVHLGLTFSFSPGFVISLNVFDDALFMRPRYRHYYYGDYFASRHYRRGIYPWFSLHARRVVYDPIYAHQRWMHRKDRGWENRLETRFRERRENEKLRPPRSFDYRKGPKEAGRGSGSERLNFVTPLDRAVTTKGGAYRFRALSQKERREFSQREKEVRTYRKERQDRETLRRIMSEEKILKKTAPNKEKFYRSPIMDRSNEKPGRKNASPARYNVPKPNPNVEPLQRKYDTSRLWEKSQKQEESGSQRPGNTEWQSRDRMHKSEDRKQRGGGGGKNWNGR
jgi:hypothetical protein